MSKEIMVIDYEKCVRVARGDEMWAVESTPYRCPACARGVTIGKDPETGDSISSRSLTDRSFSGKLRLSWQPVPVCENHSSPVEMVEV